MADILESAADRFLQSDIASTTTPLTQAAATDALTRKEVQTTRPLPVTPNLVPASSGNLGFVQRNTQTDATGNTIPLDVESGMGPWLELQTAINRTQENQLKFLQNKFPEQNARLSDTGEPILRINDAKTGKPKDVLLNPKGMDAEDFMDLMAQAPEIVAGFLAARSGQGAKAAPGIWNALKTIGKMAIGTEAAGAVKDVGVRTAEGLPIDPAEIATARGGMAALDVGAGIATGAAGKALFKTISPFSNRGPLQFDLQQAQDYFQSKYGIKIPTSPGETTGSSLLSRSEAMALQKPGSSAPLEEILKQKTDQIARIQKIALGLSPDATEAEIASLPSAEEVGKKAIGSIGAKNLPIESEIETARKGVLQSGTGELKSIVPGTPMDRTKLGESLQNKIVTDFQEFQKQAADDYAAVEAHPLAQQNNLPATDLANKANALLGKLPTAKQGVLEDFVPAGVMSKLKTLSSLQGEDMRLSDLIGIRTEVRNAISEAEVIPGKKTHYLNEMEKMLTTSIKDGLGQLNDPTLKQLWETANNNYATGIKRFDTKLVKPLLADVSQSGSKGPFQIASEAIDNPDRFFAYKEYYGANSPEFQNLKRGVADDILNKSTNPASGVIDGKAFLSKINSLPKEVVDQVFGVDLSRAARVAEAMGVAQGSININELKDAVATQKTITGQKLLNMMSAEGKRAEVYQNEIRKRISSGTDVTPLIKPTEFVDNLSAAQPQTVKEIMTLLGDQPETLDDIRSLTVQKILNAGSMFNTAADNPAILRGMPRHLSSENLQKALGDKTQREIYKSILGQSTFDDLTNLTKALAPGEMNQRTFAAAGGLSAGMQITGLVERGELKYVDRAVRNLIIASIYTLKPVRDLITNTAISKEGGATALNYIIASTPFIESLYRQVGAKKAAEVTAQAKASIDRSLQERGAVRNPVADEAAADRFLNQ